MQIKKSVKIGAAALAATAAAAFLYYQNNDLTVTTVKSKHGRDKCRITQISDLHNKEFGRKNTRLLRAIRNQEPDLIAITGDAVFAYNPNIKITVDFVRRAMAIAPVFFVTGNHEDRLSKRDYDELMLGIQSAGAVVLDNSSVKVRMKGGKSFRLCGVSDINLSAGNITCCSDHKEFTVLLAHEPQFVEFFSACGADLVLAGHAHGGQVRLPYIGGLIAPNQGLFPKYYEGVHKLGETELVISRGLGKTIFPFRVFNRPEIVNVDIGL